MLGAGELAALLAAAAWALTSITVRSLSGRLTAITMNAARTTVAAALLLGLLPFAGDPAQVPLFAYLLLIGSLVGLVLGDSLYFESIRVLGVPRAAPLSAIYPLFTTLLAVTFLGASPSGFVIAGIVVVVLGVYLLVQAGSLIAPLDLFRGASARGAAIALLAALLWALSTVLLRPALLEMDVFLANAVRMPVAAAMLWLLAWRWGRLTPPVVMTGRTRGGLVLAGALSAASVLAFLVGVQIAGAAKAATLSSTSPLFAVPISALLFRETISRRVVLGGLLSVVGIGLLVSG